MRMHTNDKYPPKSMWKMIVATLGRILITTIIFILLLILSYEKANSDMYEPPKISSEPQNEPVSNVKVEQDKILDCLQKLENYDHLTKWWDVHSYTYGDYALKLPTVKDYRPNITDEEAIAIATNPVQAREIAREIMFVRKETWRYGYATNPKSTIGKIYNGACNK